MSKVSLWWRSQALFLFLFIFWIVEFFSSWRSFSYLRPGANVQFLGVVESVHHEFAYGKASLKVRARSDFYMIHFDVPWGDDLERGDRVSVNGRVSDNSANERFSFVRSYVYLDGAKILERQHTNWIIRWIRKRSLEGLQSAFPVRVAGIIAGIVLGDDSLLHDRLLDRAREVGLSHILVISGYNISLLISVVFILASSVFHKKHSMWISFTTMWIFTVLVGFSAPVFRAAVMSSLIMFGVLTGRVRNMGRTLLLSALFSLCCYPFWVFDVGWQLSFLATAALVFMDPILRRFVAQFYMLKIDMLDFRFAFIFRYAIDVLLSTSSVMIVLIPWLLYWFQSSQLLTFVSNLLVLWLIPFITSWGLLSIVVYVFWPLLGAVFLQVLWIPTEYILWVVDTLVVFPLAINMQISLWNVIFYYLLLIIAIKYYEYKKIS